MYSMPYSCGKVYKGETRRSLKVRLGEHWKAVCQGEVKKLGRADHIWKEKENHLPLWDEVKIIDRKEHWRIRHLKRSSAYVGLQKYVKQNKYRSKYDLGINNQKCLIKKKMWYELK